MTSQTIGLDAHWLLCYESLIGQQSYCQNNGSQVLLNDNAFGVGVKQ